MDLGAIDIPMLVSAILAVVVAVGGVVGRSYIKRALTGILLIAGILDSLSRLLVRISEAGEDGQLTAEEWAGINEIADEIAKKLTEIRKQFM